MYAKKESASINPTSFRVGCDTTRGYLFSFDTYIVIFDENKVVVVVMIWLNTKLSLAA